MPQDHFMQGAFARKKEEHKPVEAVHAPAVSPFDSSVHLSEKKAPIARPMSPSMSEGPMQLRESQNIEQQGRASFEKSVKAELDAIKARMLAKLAAKKKRKEKKKKDRKKKGSE